MCGIRKIESMLMRIGTDLECDVPIQIPLMLEETGLLLLSPPGTKDLWRHTMDVIAACPQDVMVRWAALYHDIGKPAVFLNHFDSRFANHEQASYSIWMIRAKMLAMSQPKADAVGCLVLNHMRIQQYQPVWTNKAFGKLVKGYEGQFSKAISLAKADGMPGHLIEDMERRILEWKQSASKKSSTK